MEGGGLELGFKNWSKLPMDSTKGQLISKCLLVFSILKKTNEKIRLYYYGTSIQIVICSFFGRIIRSFFGRIEGTKKTFRNYPTEL